MNLQRAQQTSNTGEHLDSARAQPKVPVTSSEKISYLRSKGFSLDTCAIENDTFSEFINLIYDYRDIFAYSETDIPECNLLKCHLSTYADAKPTRSRPYRLSDEMRVQVDRQLDQLLAAGVIAEENGSPFASPIVMIRKRDNTWRFCVDFRRLNAVSIPLYHELPLLDDILDLMTRNKAKYMTTLDMRSAYHQLGITEESSYKTTFCTPHRGSYKYLRLPQGHCQSPYWMTVALNQLFRHQIGSYLLVYLDDIICISESSDQHLKHLQTIFEKFRGANLKLHPKKCKFFQTEVKYLGFIFNSDGVKSDPQKTAIITNYPTPRKVRDVRSFLGMVNYFRRYIKNYANLSYPSYRLLKKDVPFLWTEKEEQ